MIKIDAHHCMVEAGTGIGKSLSYILGTIPLALASKEKSLHRFRDRCALQNNCIKSADFP